MPKQAVTESQRTEDWGIRSAKALLQRSKFRSALPDGDLQELYDLYAGVIEDADYTHVTKPYGKDRQNFPAKLHNYPIIKPVVDLLRGEFARRPIAYSVVVTNGDVHTRKMEKLKEKVKEMLLRIFQQEAQKVGLAEGVDEQPVSFEKEMSRFNENYRDIRAITGQHIVSYLQRHLGLEMQRAHAFADYLITGYCYSIKEVVLGEVRYDILSPMDVDGDFSPGVTFVEDGAWASVRRWFHPSDVIERFADVLKDSEVAKIESPANSQGTGDGIVTTMAKTDIDTPDTDVSSFRGALRTNPNMVEVAQIFWRVPIKYTVARWTDRETGDIREREVSETYIATNDEKLDTIWGEEVWEATRIDGCIWKNVRPHPVQRRSLDNPARVRLPINGITSAPEGCPVVSLVQLGKPYQLMYNIYRYRLDNAVARAKGMIAVVDLSMKPPEWTLDKWFHLLDAMGILFVETNREGNDQLTNTQRQVLDLSLKSIDQYLMLLEAILNEWERVTGVTRQRQGMMGTYDLKSTTENALVQSSYITEPIFQRFEFFWEREMNGLLDDSRYAFVGGKKTPYILSDGSQQMLIVDGLEHMETEYGIFAVSSPREVQKIEALRAMAAEMAKVGSAPMSLVANVLELDSFAQLKEAIHRAEELEQQQTEAQRQHESEQTQAMIQAKERERMMESEDRERDRQSREDIALIKVGSDKDKSGMELVKERARLAVQRDSMNIDRQQQEKDRAQTRELEKERLEIERIKARKTPRSN